MNDNKGKKRKKNYDTRHTYKLNPVISSGVVMQSHNKTSKIKRENEK